MFAAPNNRECRDRLRLLPAFSFSNQLGAFLLFVTALEAAFFGSGRLLTVGPATVKMLLYIIGLAFVAYSLMSGSRMHLATCFVVLSFAFVAASGVLIGTLNGATTEVLLDDLRVYSYVPAICFFDVTMRSERSIELVSRAIRISAASMSLLYGVAVLLLLTGKISVVDIAQFVHVTTSDDFMISDEGFGMRLFYKGFIYLGVGALFWAARSGWCPRLIAAFAVVSIALSGTRGLTIAVIICIALLIALTDKNRIRGRLLAVGMLVLLIAGAPIYVSLARGADQVASSNLERTVTLQEVAERTTASSILWGHGLGIGVPNRPGHMEITYMEILHKNGMLGLSVWVSLLGWILWRYSSLRKSGVANLATPFFLGALLIAIDTFTNPELNNPIGLSMVFETFCALEYLNEQKRATFGS